MTLSKRTHNIGNTHSCCPKHSMDGTFTCCACNKKTDCGNATHPFNVKMDEEFDEKYGSFELAEVVRKGDYENIKSHIHSRQDALLDKLVRGGGGKEIACD